MELSLGKEPMLRCGCDWSRACRLGPHELRAVMTVAVDAAAVRLCRPIGFFLIAAVNVSGRSRCVALLRLTSCSVDRSPKHHREEEQERYQRPRARKMQISQH